MRFRGWLAVGWLLTVSTAMAGGLYPEVVIPYSATAPVIDGELDAAWEASLPYDLGHFDGTTDHLIVENYLTQVRFLWNEEFLFVSFVCTDTDIAAPYRENDAPLYEGEICEMMFHTPKGSTLYELSVAPNGARYDARLRWDDRAKLQIDADFDFVRLQTAAKILPREENRLIWRVEMAIPWRELEVAGAKAGDVFLGNALRYERIAPAELRKRLKYEPDDFLPMCLFPTHIQAWPAATSSLGRFRLAAPEGTVPGDTATD